MTPLPETASLLAQRGPAAAHLAGWLAVTSFLSLLLAIWDERRGMTRPAKPGTPHRRCPRKPT